MTKLKDFLNARIAPAIALVLLLIGLACLPDYVSKKVTNDEPAVFQEQPTPQRTPDNPWQTSRIESISADKTMVELQQCPDGLPNGSTLTVTAQSNDMLSALKTGYSQGDRVSVTVDVDKRELKTLQVVQYRVSAPARVITYILAALAVACIFWLLLARDLSKLFLGTDNRYSNSLFQMVVWFSMLMVTYVSVLRLRWACGGPDYAGGINVPQHLLILSGLSALTFAGAKAITVAKAGSGQTKVVKDGDPSFPADLFNDDAGQFDIADFQTVIITLLAVIVYAVQAYAFLDLVELHKTITLPDVDTTILAVFGLGQGAYLAKKQIGECDHTE